MKKIIIAMGLSVLSFNAMANENNDKSMEKKDEINAKEVTISSKDHVKPEKNMENIEKTNIPNEIKNHHEVDLNKETQGKNLQESIKRGGTIFSTCVGCHGATALGGVGPNLSHLETIKIKNKLNKFKKGEISGGMAKMMTPMAQNLSEKDIEDVANYIHFTFGEKNKK